MNSDVSSVQMGFTAMGTECQIRLWMDRASPSTLISVMTLMAARIHMLEQCWTRFNADSELMIVNRHAGKTMPVSDDMLMLVLHMKAAHEFTSGLYDPSMGATLSNLGYDRTFADLPSTSPAGVVPTGRSAGLDGLVVDEAASTVLVPEGVTLDPGGIGKGLAGDMLVVELLTAGIPATGVMIDLGGDIVLAGSPGTDQSWLVEIRNEADRDGLPLGIVEIVPLPMTARVGIATSTTLTRRWSAAGHPRHHVLDPATNQPSDTTLTQATVVANTGWQAEAAATAALLLNQNGPQWLAEAGLPAAVGRQDGTVTVLNPSDAVKVLLL